MTSVFADSYFFIAMLNSRDKAHARSLEWSRTNVRRLVTTQFVLLEVADALCHPDVRPLVVRLIGELTNDANTTVVPVSEQRFTDGLARFDSRQDKDWTLTDCISFIVMETEGITDALTADRHFEQAGFVALLK